MAVDLTGSAIPVVDTPFTDWEFNQDPFPVLEEWRALGPVVYNSHQDVYMTFSYRDCAKVLGNVAEFDSAIAAANFERAFGGPTMESIDTPRHHDMRGVWARDFRRDVLEDEQRRLVTSVVDAQIDAFIDRLTSEGTVDAVSGLTRSIPTLVIANMLGIDRELHQQFSDWSDGIGGFSEARGDTSPRGEALVQRGLDSSRALNEYLGEVIEDRRRRGPGGEDLVSTMVFHPFAAQMEEREMVASSTQLVFAGNETTAKLMASTLVVLARHPDQREAIRKDRSLIPQAIEEILRWMTVVANAEARHACSPESNIQGIRVPQGAAMAPLIAAANRDPSRWENPERFDIFRPQKQHLGFGFGMHVCLGLNLARLETHVFLDRMLERHPEWDVQEPIDYGRNFLLRGPVAVPIAAS